MRTISNSDDVIDSRDIIARIEELRELSETDDWGDDGKAELLALESLADEAEGCGDWKYGETLIRESYFQEYAQQLAEDIGAVNADATWPNNCIDWEQAARELKYDYSAVDYDGVTYYIRS